VGRWWWIERMEAYGFEYSPRLSEYVLDRLIVQMPRNFAYLKYTGLIFRNPVRAQRGRQGCVAKGFES
jgi:hypothetical protein